MSPRCLDYINAMDGTEMLESEERGLVGVISDR